MPEAPPFGGFVDIQVNGAAGVDFSDPALTETAAQRAFDSLAALGCAAFCPTVISLEIESYRRLLPVLAAAVKAHPRALGIHLEGRGARCG